MPVLKRHSQHGAYFRLPVFLGTTRDIVLLGIITVGLLGACAPQPSRGFSSGVSLVVLPRQPDGHVGSVMVRPLNGKPVLVDKPYVEANLRDRKNVETSPIDRRSISDKFGKTLAALPAQPTTYLVYFVEGTEELKADAKRAIEKVFSDFASRPSPEIAVVGHTDFVGSDQYNDTLSLQRALRVRDLLIQRGIPAKLIEAAGRGKREPVVKTSDAIAERRNRRVEIIVR